MVEPRNLADVLRQAISDRRRDLYSDDQRRVFGQAVDWLEARGAFARLADGNALRVLIKDGRQGLYSGRQRHAFLEAVDWFAAKGLLASAS